MGDLYPLKFKPIAREMIWGGDKLHRLFNKNFPSGVKIGESWEISSVKDKISVVSNGHLMENNLEELIEIYMGDLVGEKVFDIFGTTFPLLIKLIDASQDLSIQVHPGDELALRRHGSQGKTEMWYVLDAEPGATLITGFSHEISPAIFLEKLQGRRLADVLNVEQVVEGDTFFIPAGRIHAIRAGIVLAEIQQTSDITYRVYDYDRTGDDGKPRELHIDLAMDAIDFSIDKNYKTIVTEEKNVPVLLADCPYFTTHRLDFDEKITLDYNLVDSFVIYICTKGRFTLGWGKDTMDVHKGETVLIPAVIEEVSLSCDAPAGLLEVYIRPDEPAAGSRWSVMQQ
jgi:mannose-6-phosphate isomerase